MEKEIYGVVYMLIDGTNDCEYIGQTTQTVEARFKQHKKSEQYVDRMIQDHGDLFLIVILKVCYSKKELDYWERCIIKFRGTKYPNGYNMTDGGEGVSGWKHTDETKAQISATMTGSKQTDEHRANSSAAQRKRYENPEEHIKASEAQKKRYEDPAEHVKTSEALKKSRAENPISPESHAKQAESLRKHYEENPEARQHLADMTNKYYEDPEAHKRQSERMILYYQENPVSDETRAKQSVVQKARQAKLRLERLPIKVSEQNQAAARLPMPLPNLKKYHDEHPDKIKMPLTLPKGYADLTTTPIKKSTAYKSRTFKFTAEPAPVKVEQLTLNFG